jgi:hypothetical protein
MIVNYSRLGELLDERRLSVGQLFDRLRAGGVSVSLNRLNRLSTRRAPLRPEDLALAEAISRVLRLPTSKIVVKTISKTEVADLVERFPGPKQRRMNKLMDRNNEGLLSADETKELAGLVREVAALALRNARRIDAARRHHLANGRSRRAAKKAIAG